MSVQTVEATAANGEEAKLTAKEEKFVTSLVKIYSSKTIDKQLYAALAECVPYVDAWSRDNVANLLPEYVKDGTESKTFTDLITQYRSGLLALHNKKSYQKENFQGPVKAIEEMYKYIVILNKKLSGKPAIGRYASAIASVQHLYRDFSIRAGKVVNLASSDAESPEALEHKFRKQLLRLKLREFREIDITDDGVYLKVLTEPIVLVHNKKQINLGRFWICLAAGVVDHTRMHSGSFTVIAQTPALSLERGYCHPHINGNGKSPSHICLGDAHTPITMFMSMGEIVEAFIAVRSVIRTYNNSSPYEPLENWITVKCSTCRKSVSSIKSCSTCRTKRCEDCSIVCLECDTLGCVVCTKKYKKSPKARAVSICNTCIVKNKELAATMVLV